MMFWQFRCAIQRTVGLWRCRDGSWCWVPGFWVPRSPEPSSTTATLSRFSPGLPGVPLRHNNFRARESSSVMSEIWRVASGLIPENDHVVYAVGGSSPVDSDLDPANDAATVLAPLVRVLELLRQRPHAAITYLSSGGTQVARSTASPILSRPGRMSDTADQFLRNPEVDR